MCGRPNPYATPDLLSDALVKTGEGTISSSSEPHPPTLQPTKPQDTPGLLTAVCTDGDRTLDAHVRNESPFEWDVGTEDLQL